MLPWHFELHKMLDDLHLHWLVSHFPLRPYMNSEHLLHSWPSPSDIRLANFPQWFFYMYHLIKWYYCVKGNGLTQNWFLVYNCDKVGTTYLLPSYILPILNRHNCKYNISWPLIGSARPLSTFGKETLTQSHCFQCYRRET